MGQPVDLLAAVIHRVLQAFAPPRRLTCRTAPYRDRAVLSRSRGTWRAATSVFVYAVFFDRRRPVVRLAVWVLPQCARNWVMNVCSSRASTASGANASATASAV